MPGLPIGVGIGLAKHLLIVGPDLHDCGCITCRYTGCEPCQCTRTVGTADVDAHRSIAFADANRRAIRLHEPSVPTALASVRSGTDDRQAWEMQT